jgi:hypothetical protein
MEQDLFNQPPLQPKLPFTATQLRDTGMKMALEHAEQITESWGDKCFELLKQYLELNREKFLTEYFRTWCETGNRIAEPPSKRAYGGVMSRAARAGLIRSTGYAPTSNPKAHCAPTNVWVATTADNF